MGIDVVLSSNDWHHQICGESTLHWRGHPDSLDDLKAELTTAVRTGVGTPACAGGHWTAVLESGSSVVVAQDPIRSWPMFIADDLSGNLTVTDSIGRARTAAGSRGRDEASALEFLHLGYVTGPDTLFKGVSQVQAGEWLLLDNQRRKKLTPVVGLRPHASPGLSDPDELDSAFDKALETVLDRLFTRIGDRQVVIPLSGGLDSRLLAVALRERGHDNVLNFTYGVGRSREVEISYEVATALGQRWEFVEYTRAEIRAAWESPAAAAFINDSYAGASLPHIQDWYPLAELQRRGLINNDAVFLPGHTIVGNMHDEDILRLQSPVSRTALTKVLLGHHATIRPDSSALLRSDRFAAKLATFLNDIGFDGTPESRLDALESWNVLERQTKYINNSMRGYEHFGYEWALPMLDRELLEVWASFDLSIAQDREWYRSYVNRRYSAVIGGDIPTFEAYMAANMSKKSRNTLREVLRRLGVLGLVERRVVAQAYARHPMGFQEFVGQTSPAELRRFILRGGLPMGIYAERFLEDTWNHHTSIFDGNAG